MVSHDLASSRERSDKSQCLGCLQNGVASFEQSDIYERSIVNNINEMDGFDVRAERFAFSRGSVALYALLLAADVKPGDEVIVPVYTCPEVLRPISEIGARPVFCDIEATTFGVSQAELAKNITPLTRAIIIQHTFGIPSFVGADLRAQFSTIPLIEDCCHVPVLGPGTAPMGTIGDASFYSFGYGKPLSLGGGGLAITNTQSLKEKMTAIYSTFSPPGIRDTCFSTLKALKSQLKRTISPELAGYVGAVRLGMKRSVIRGLDQNKCDPQLRKSGGRICTPCSLFLKLLVKYKCAQITRTRRWAASYYERGFRSIGIECLKEREQKDVALWRYPIWTKNKDVVLNEARRKHAPVFDWGAWPLRGLRLDPAVDDCFPVARKVTDHFVTIAIEETGDHRTIDSTLELLNDMKKRGAL